MTLEQLGIIAAVVFGAISLILTLTPRFKSRSEVEEERIRIEEYNKYKQSISHAFATLKLEHERRFTTLEIFMKVLEKDLDRMLHSPHRIELDTFSEKSQRDELTREEALQYAEVLEQTLHDPHLKPGEEVGIKLRKAMLIAKYRLLELLT